MRPGTALRRPVACRGHAIRVLYTPLYSLTGKVCGLFFVFALRSGVLLVIVAVRRVASPLLVVGVVLLALIVVIGSATAHKYAAAADAPAHAAHHNDRHLQHEQHLARRRATLWRAAIGRICERSAKSASGTSTLSSTVSNCGILTAGFLGEGAAAARRMFCVRSSKEGRARLAAPSSAPTTRVTVATASSALNKHATAQRRAFAFRRPIQWRTKCDDSGVNCLRTTL